MQYSIDDLVRLAKRDSNTIRPYLYVNPKQGKHIPARPGEIFDMCNGLADIVNRKYLDDKIFVIGFAETATGIASAVCHFLNNVIYYQNTTREYQKDKEYLYFTESHSHATDQLLRLTGIQKCLEAVDRIIFIDDEVTTGNTICKLISAIEEKYNVTGIKYSIVSILNSMPEERLAQLKDSGIECLYLAKLPFEYNKEYIINVEYEKNRDTIIRAEGLDQINEVVFNTKVNVREVANFSEYERENLKFAEMIRSILKEKHYKDFLVIGTEEFMYPALYLGEVLSRNAIADDVRIHATTRSPIIASGRDGYPLYQRYQVRSLYDQGRNTYIYNLRKYDKVVIITDTLQKSAGLFDIVNALESVGNREIVCARWNYICEDRKVGYE